jgi:hypothetical protein
MKASDQAKTAMIAATAAGGRFSGRFMRFILREKSPST